MFGAVAFFLMYDHYDKLYWNTPLTILVLLGYFYLTTLVICITDEDDEESYPFLLRIFVLNPANNRSFFWKEGFMISYLLVKKNGLFFFKNFVNFLKNLSQTSRLNPIQFFLWRPLIKRWSYFGLYVHSRAGFLKFFKNQNVK